MKHTHLHPDTPANTFLMILKKVADKPKTLQGHKPVPVSIQSVTALTPVSQRAFNSIISRGDIRKLLKKLGLGHPEPMWTEKLTVETFADFFWPEKVKGPKKKKEKKKKKR